MNIIHFSIFRSAVLSRFYCTGLIYLLCIYTYIFHIPWLIFLNLNIPHYSLIIIFWHDRPILHIPNPSPEVSCLCMKHWFFLVEICMRSQDQVLGCTFLLGSFSKELEMCVYLSLSPHGIHVCPNCMCTHKTYTMWVCIHMRKCSKYLYTHPPHTNNMYIYPHTHVLTDDLSFYVCIINHKLILLSSILFWLRSILSSIDLSVFLLWETWLSLSTVYSTWLSPTTCIK